MVALEGMDLPPSEVLFLDDGQRNVEAAKHLGMHARLVTGPSEARRVLAEYGVVGEAPAPLAGGAAQGNR